MNGYSAFLLKLTLPASKIIMRVRFVPMEQTMKQGHVPDEREIVKTLKGFSINLLKIYPSSFSFTDGLFYGLIRTPDGKRLAVLGDKGLVLADPFRGTCFHAASTLKVCDLSPENTECLMTFFLHQAGSHPETAVHHHRHGGSSGDCDAGSSTSHTQISFSSHPRPAILS
jgi:hypothetical protein